MDQWQKQEQNPSSSTSLTLPPWYTVCLIQHQLQDLLHTQFLMLQISSEKQPSVLLLHFWFSMLPQKEPSHHDLFTPLIPISHILKIISCRKTKQTSVSCPLLPCIELSLCDISLLFWTWLLYHQKVTAGLEAWWRSGASSGANPFKNQFVLRGSRVVLLSPSKISSLIQVSYSPCADLCYKEKKMTEQET